MLKFVTVAFYDPVFVDVAVAVFKTPFDERPELASLLFVGAREQITGCAVCAHRSVAPVADPRPEGVALADYGRWNRLVFAVHIAREKAERVVRRFVSALVAQKREEGIYVFGLVVRPNRRVVVDSPRRV